MDSRTAPMRPDGSPTSLLVGVALLSITLLGCVGARPPRTDGACCRLTGPVSYDCASIENLGPGADLDGRCNAVNQGQSCSWDYGDEMCCEKAVADGFGDATCGPSGECCKFTGPVGHDCASIENLGPGADLDGRCNQVNQSQSCSWDYGDLSCCKTAVDDGFPGAVVCN